MYVMYQNRQHDGSFEKSLQVRVFGCVIIININIDKTYKSIYNTDTINCMQKMNNKEGEDI